MVAIVTTYIGPTNFRGSRVKATAPDTAHDGQRAFSVTLSWDDALNPEQNHDAAASALALKYQWSGTWNRGSLHRGYVYVRSTARLDNIAFRVVEEA